MNPPNPFGSPQGGAFQAPSNTIKTGLFQSFGQQSSNNQPQTMGFFQPSAFGQTAVLNQPSSHGNTVFGLAPAFGQSPAQLLTTPTINQAPVFGQPSGAMSSSGFGGGTVPAFGQTSGQNQSLVFGQTPAFGQTSAFGQAPGFSQQAPGFGKQPPAFGQSQMASGSTTTLGQPQPIGFGKTAFGQPSSTSVTTSVFGTGLSGTQSKAFGPSKFSFKPASEALFKPIYSASPEPTNPQSTTMTTSPFSSSGNQTSSSNISNNSTTTGFSLLTNAKSGPLGFSFSQPAAAPSISAQNKPITTSSSSGPTNTLQFTFSQPAAPSSSSTTKASMSQPTTPSSFSFSVKAPQSQAAPLFGGNSFGLRPAFCDTKVQAETSTHEKGNNLEALEGTNIFARTGKGVKRKEDPVAPSGVPEKPITEEDVPAETESQRQPPKRPLMRSRGAQGGLFGRALSGLRKDGTVPVRQEATKETPSKWEETEREDVQGQEDNLAATPPTVQAPTREVEKAQKSVSEKAADMKFETATPAKRCVRRESSDSLGNMSYSDCTVIQCKNVPPGLNKKDTIEMHFARFGKVSKVFCRPAKNLAIVHFDDHASAAKAKKKGKHLHRHALFIVWQRKKNSPGQKGSRPEAGKEKEAGESQEAQSSMAASSPLKRPALRAPAVSSTMTFSHSSPVKKSTIAKSLQFDTEPNESSTESHISERPIPSSLLHLVGQVAETAEDKYRLLEQRDKVLRQGRPKRTDLDLSKVFVGTCPDMCPEKERYMRETRKQLSIFEVIPNTEMVEHTAAIKEYSRSSADQEEPLPHELRPLPVLSMTMDYLVTQIMDQGHDNYRDWYDFVWNRTRGIRKDITQQHLCCPNTVSLIEKCTRFHVHCAHHLCEEPMSSFDAKINNENMTKCLQSLKEMYQDLTTRQIYCSQEAEFRQYNVLLKLNDGDILREVQQFRDDVRNSPEVKFAVQAFTAVNSNNFVRFFKLVKGASYLSCCLLHRYFNQVRAKALKTLTIAHTLGPRSTVFPLEDITRMLMFRDTTEATDFIQQYGLNVNEDMVELSRTVYQESELPLSQKKSELILAKKTVLIGEVINGGLLPTPPQHIPVCSFDSQNKYRGEAPVAEPVTCYFTGLGAKPETKALSSAELRPKVKLVLDTPSGIGLTPAVTNEPDESSSAYTADVQQPQQQIPQPQPVKSPSPLPAPQPVYSNEDIMAELDSVIEEVLGAAVCEVANVGASYAKTALFESNMQVESLVSEVLGQMLQEVSSTEFRLEKERVAEEKRKLEEARRRQEHEDFLTQFSLFLCTEIIHEVLNETIKETSTAEIQQAVNEKVECVAKCTEQVCTSLVEETLNADIAVMIEEILNAERQRIHKYIKMWRDVVAVRRQLKRQMRGFPAAPCCVDPRFKLKALAPSAPPQQSMADLARGVVNLGNAGTLALSSTRLLKMRQEAIHQMRVHYYYQRLLDEKVWAPLDLPALVAENIPDPPVRIFWKLALLLPSNHESVASLADRILSDWLEVKLGGDRVSEVGEVQPDGTLQTLSVTSTLQEKGQRTHNVHTSVKVSRGPLTEDSLSEIEEGFDLHGTGALVMLLPAMPVIESGHYEQDVPLLSALLQLKQLQQATIWPCPLPLVILVPGPDSGAGDTENLVEALMLHTLVTEGLISEYAFFFIPETTSDIQGSKQLKYAMCWLLARAPPSCPLSCQSLVQLVEATLSREFTARVYSHRQERATTGLPSQEPAPIIELYNTVLAHIADTVSSKDLWKISPPREFYLPKNRHFVPHPGLTSAAHLAWLRKAILSLQLPQWEKLSVTDSWSELCSSIYGYAAQIPVSHQNQPLLMSRLENLLERVRVKSNCTKTPRSVITMGKRVNVVESVIPAYSLIPWDDVLVICIDYKLKDWQLPDRPVCEDAVTEDGEILVYFPTGSQNGFHPPEAWTQAIRQTHRQKQQKQEEKGACAAACVTATSLSIRQRLFHSLAEPLEATAAPMDITHTLTTQELLAHKLLQSLEQEKAESKRSMEQLQSWLDGDPLVHLTTPLFIPSSTLLSMPTTIHQASTAKTRDDRLHQEPDYLSETADCPNTVPVSMEWRLNELRRQILASQEEERACRLKLSSLLSIVED